MYPLPQRQRLKARTIETVASDLTGTMQQSVPGSGYLKCRYDPFAENLAKAGIPDGRGKNLLVRDIKLVHNINVSGSEVVNAMILPTLPFPVRFATDGYLTTTGAIAASTIDGVALGGNTTPGLPPVASRNYLGVSPLNALRTAFNIPTSPGETGMVTGCRIVTLGWRVMYTGPASSAQGTITALDFGWSVDTEAPNLAAIQYTASAGATAVATDAVTADFATAWTCNIPTMVMNAANNTKATVRRPENGMRGVLKMQSSSDNHVFKPWYEDGAMLIAAVPGGFSVPVNVRHTTWYPTGSVGLMNFLDPALGGTLLQFIGAGSYRLELVICFEQELGVNNLMIDMTKPSPMLNRPALDMDNMINSTVHHGALNENIVTLPSLDARFSNMRIGGRQRVRRKPKQKPVPTPCSQQKQTGKTARKRRNRQRRRARKQQQ